MPIYEFRCRSCGRTGEVLVMSGRGEIRCAGCGSVEMEKLISRTAPVTGGEGAKLPGRSDHGCCGQRPSQAAGCAGPGTCCGKANA